MDLRYLLLTAKLLWSKFSFPPHRFHLLVVGVQGRLFYLRSFRFLYLFRHLTLMLQILLMPALLDPTRSKLPKLVGCFGASGLVTTSFPYCRLFTIKDKCKKLICSPGKSMIFYKKETKKIELVARPAEPPPPAGLEEGTLLFFRSFIRAVNLSGGFSVCE